MNLSHLITQNYDHVAADISISCVCVYLNIIYYILFHSTFYDFIFILDHVNKYYLLMF